MAVNHFSIKSARAARPAASSNFPVVLAWSCREWYATHARWYKAIIFRLETRKVIIPFISSNGLLYILWHGLLAHWPPSKQRNIEIYGAVLLATYPPSPFWDGDGLKDDVYGGVVAQGNVIPGLPCEWGGVFLFFVCMIMYSICIM